MLAVCKICYHIKYDKIYQIDTVHGIAEHGLPIGIEFMSTTNITIYPSNKSHNALDNYPTMHHL